MMRIIPRGPDAYLFRDGSHTPVGWLRARTVRFTHFASHRDAVAAAVQGGLALAAYAGGAPACVPHAGARVARPPDGVGTVRARGDGPAGERGVRVVHDGRYEWVCIDAARVARLVPPADVEMVPSIEEVLACGGRAPCVRGPDISAYSLEFLLSEDASLDACLTVAQLLYVAVQHHRRRPSPAGDARTSTHGGVEALSPRD